MKFLLFLTLGIFLFLALLAYLFKKSAAAKREPKREHTIEKNIEAIQEKEKKSHLGKRLFYRIKSGLMRK